MERGKYGFGGGRREAESSKVCGGTKVGTQHANIAMPGGNGHDARSNHVKRTVHGMQRHLRNSADRRSAVKNVSERVFQRLNGFHRRVNRERRSLSQVEGANIVKSQNVIRVRVCE